MTEDTWHADPLIWGHGPKVFDIFLEPTCPFSARAFGKLDALLEKAGADNITVKLRLLSQPWHMFSGVITRAILAASTLDGGRDTAKAVMAAVYAHRDDYEFTDHAAGPNMDATPNANHRSHQVAFGCRCRRGFRNPDAGPTGQKPYALRAPERRSCFAYLHDRRTHRPVDR